MQFEARPYGPDSTPEEVEAMRARISVLPSDNIVLYRELPVMSIFAVDVMFGRVEELLRPQRRACLIVDVSEGGRPDAEARKRILEWVRKLSPPLTSIGVVTATNTLARIAAKFVQAMVPVPLRLFATISEAEEAMRRGWR